MTQDAARPAGGGGAPVPEPTLTPEERAALARGIAQFNDRLFYECHDTLEEAWSGMRGAPRGFFQGLIQAAVAFYHLGNGNRAGALSTLRRSLERLRRYPSPYEGVELAPLVAALEPWLEALEAGGETPAEPPRIATAPGEAA
jgi:predicted metal-dependent hydrolase